MREQGTGVYPPNFELLHSDASWRSTWTHIVPGRFSSSPYSGLLFFEGSTGYAEVYNTDGQGRIVAPALRSYSPLGSRTTWTHVIPGLFGSSGLTGLLLYDKPAGFARFLECVQSGHFVQRSEYSDWRNTWTHIVPGMFTTSVFTSLLFYSPSEGYGELWNTNGTGLAGVAPVQSFAGWRSTWTHLVAADFFWTPGYISSKPVLSDLIFYEGSTGWTEMYRFDENGLVPYPVASRTLSASVANVVAGNFGGFGNSDLLLHDRTAGEIQIYSFSDLTEASSEIVDRERLRNLRRTIDLVVVGNFYMANPDDHWFNDGPTLFSAVPPYDRNWRAGTGAFSDLLLYDRAAGLGETYLHEPLPPPEEALAAYASSLSSHGGAPPVASGSVLPGETISFHVSSAEPYTIRIYRQGETEQFMVQLGSLWPATPALSIGRNAYRDGAEWPVAVNFAVPNYPSGLYLARIQDTASPPRMVDVPFVVRAPSVSQSKVLLVIADTTYEAYNDWGGRNVYGHATLRDTPTGPERAFVGAFPSSSALRIPYAFEVSFNRPFANGLGNTPKWQKWEVPFVQWLARRGIAVDVCTSRDLHVQAPTTPNYRLLLFVGHHEYWTKEMRDNVENFAKTGGGVGFFSGNVCWWQIRLNADGNRLVCYKVAGFDPILDTDSALTTVNWYDNPILRPETSLTGVSWFGSLVVPENDPIFQYTVTNAGHWAFQGTGIQNGDRFGGYSEGTVIGSELDRIQNPGPNGMQSPAGYTIARVLDPRPNQNNYELGTMGSFTPVNGTGTVFNAATINWTLGLNHNVGDWNIIDQITLNVIDRLGPTFRKVSGLATDIGVGPNGSVWIVSNTPVDGGFSIMRRIGSNWSKINGGAVRIAVDPDGNPWVVNSSSSIFKLVNDVWQTMPGTATDIGIGANGTVWAIGTASANGGHPIFRWDGSAWTSMGGNGIRIAVDQNGNAWVVNSAGGIFEYVGSAWQSRPELATDIGVGPDGTVWVVGIATAPSGRGNGVFRWNGTDWRHVPGGATNISVGSGGNPWMVSATHEIFFWD